jgi:arsenate reductase
VKRLHWPIPDPAAVPAGSAAEDIRARFRAARDQIRERISVLGALMELPGNR